MNTEHSIHFVLFWYISMCNVILIFIYEYVLASVCVCVCPCTMYTVMSSWCVHTTLCTMWYCNHCVVNMKKIRRNTVISFDFAYDAVSHTYMHIHLKYIWLKWKEVSICLTSACFLWWIFSPHTHTHTSLKYIAVYEILIPHSFVHVLALAHNFMILTRCGCYSRFIAFCVSKSRIMR